MASRVTSTQRDRRARRQSLAQKVSGTGDPQAPNPKPKSQASLNADEISNSKRNRASAFLFDYCDLEFPWDLELGIWDFRGDSRGRAASICARSGSSQGGNTKVSPRCSGSSSTANPGPSVASSKRTPPGSGK